MAITDEESAKAWLEAEGRSHEEQIAIAARCALRALPGIGTAGAATMGDIALSVLRAILTSGVASKVPTPEVREASHSAARSAAYSAAFSAIDADALWLEEGKGRSLFEQSLWPDGGVPDFFDRSYKVLTAFWQRDPAVWGFWNRWYESMLNEGPPMNWAIQEAVALIPDEVWEESLKAVAKRIEEIEDDLNVQPEISDEQLDRVINNIILQPLLFRDAAESTALQVEGAIGAYKQDFANTLPEGFGALEKLPPVFSNISRVLDGGTEDEEKELLRREIRRLHGVISELQQELRDTRIELRGLKLTVEDAAQKRNVGERLQTTLTCITLLGGLGMATAYFFGLEKEDFRYEAIKRDMEGMTSDLLGAQASPNVKSSPTVIELGASESGPKFEKPPEK